MRAFAILALLAVAAVAVSAQSSSSSTGPGPSATTICDRLVVNQGGDFTDRDDAVSTITNLISTFAATGVVGVSEGVFKNPITAPYFNGTFNYRQVGPVAHPYAAWATPDFTKASDDQDLLVNQLVAFFGAASALDCTAEGFPTYTAAHGVSAFNQYQMHANMNITATVFNEFNNEVLAAASSLQVTNEDRSAMSAYLNSFSRNNYNNANAICWTESCPCATGVHGDNCDQISASSAVQVSFVSLIAAAVLALFAMRR